MKLIELLVQETLSGNFKWPECCYALVQGSSGAVYLAGGGMPLQKFELAEDWELAEVKREQYESALATAQPQWNGEGLPPVGCEFEYSFHADNFSTWHWRRCTATGKHGVLCVDKNDTELYLNDTNNKFRPIRSEADKKREEVGLALYHAINWNAEGELVSPSRMEDYKKAYDAIAAGKIPGLRIE